MFEQLLDWYGRIHGLRSVRFRYFNVAGAWPDGVLGETHDPETHIIPKILMALASGRQEFEVYGGDYPTPDGTCVRDYIHVLDLAEAHRLALEWLGSGGEGAVLNLGNGQGYSNLRGRADLRAGDRARGQGDDRAAPGGRPRSVGGFERPRGRGAGLAARTGLTRRDRARRLGLASQKRLVGAQDRTRL